MRSGNGGWYLPRVLGVSLTVLATSFTGAAVLSGPAFAAECSPDTNVRGDLDGDGGTDLAVGMPQYSDGSGAVDVRYTGRAVTLLRGGDVGGTNEEGTGFGSAMAIGDLDGDGCADLVVGASREDATDGPGGYIGRVHIVFGSATGLDPDSAITVDHPASNGNDFDDFGTSLAVGPRTADGATVHDLFVGAPGSTVGGKKNAGAVWRYPITPGGAGGRVTVGAGSVRTQDSPGVPGAAETGDRFGEEVVTDSAGGAVASAPMEDVGKGVNAGAIWHLKGTAAGAWTTSESFSQNTSGVPGTAETGDHFGSSLSSRGYLLVGVPDENDGAKKDSGMVQLFTKNAAGSYRPGRAITQNSPGIPGEIEAGDRFGAGLVAGYAITCQEFPEAAIGAPGEDIGPRKDAGTVTLVPVDAGSGCTARGLRQGAGLNGATEAGDQVGGVLSVTLGRTDLDEDYSDRLLIGVPHEDIGANADAGMVQSNRPSITADGQAELALTFSGGQLNADRYGMVLNSAFD